MYSATKHNSQKQTIRVGQEITDTAPQTAEFRLAGTTTPYKEFTRTEYEQARGEGKDIILIYYADWCPICRGEAPLIEAGFNALNKPNAVGFRVNYNDSFTDDDEKALATEQSVTYQHTKVILKKGEIVLKDGNPWDKEDFLENINRVL